MQFAHIQGLMNSFVFLVLMKHVQALRYLMRFQSKYTCLLMNRARHEAFGAMAAANVIRAADQVRT